MAVDKTHKGPKLLSHRPTAHHGTGSCIRIAYSVVLFMYVTPSVFLHCGAATRQPARLYALRFERLARQSDDRTALDGWAAATTSPRVASSPSTATMIACRQLGSVLLFVDRAD